jgi:hypothetical protein
MSLPYSTVWQLIHTEYRKTYGSETLLDFRAKRSDYMSILSVLSMTCRDSSPSTWRRRNSQTAVVSSASFCSMRLRSTPRKCVYDIECCASNTERDCSQLNHLLTTQQAQSPAGLSAVSLMQQLVRAAPNT